MAALYARLARFARNLAASAAYELALQVVARRAGVPVAELRRRCHGRPLIGNLKRQAVYLTVMAGHSRREIARVTGLSPELVARYCRAIEEARDDPAMDRVLDELELEMTA
jgi:DNA invertase Pin-like site-specific DNA recombinase